MSVQINLTPEDLKQAVAKYIAEAYPHLMTTFDVGPLNISTGQCYVMLVEKGNELEPR